jgi:hypothetical protein
MDYADRHAAERVARALLALGLPKPLFRELHHRTDTLRDYEGVADHLRFLAGDSALTGDQKVLAQRLHACLEAWFACGSWEAAAAVALKAVPKE